MTFNCKVSADLFLRALSCASTEETRYYLKGVQIEPVDGGALLIATDGARMIMLRDKAGEASGGNAVIQVDAGAVKAMRAKRKAPRYSEAGDNLVCVADGRLTVQDDLGQPLYMQILPAVIDGTFPDWRRVVPAATVNPPAGCFDAALLAPLAKALSTGDKAMFRLYQEDATSPALMFGSSDLDAFGVLMPVRDGTKTPDRPAWACRA